MSISLVLKAFLAAKDYIDKSPCDTDVTPAQSLAYQVYENALKELESKSGILRKPENILADAMIKERNKG